MRFFVAPYSRKEIEEASDITKVYVIGREQEAPALTGIDGAGAVMVEGGKVLPYLRAHGSCVRMCECESGKPKEELGCFFIGLWSLVASHSSVNLLLKKR